MTEGHMSREPGDPIDWAGLACSIGVAVYVACIGLVELVHALKAAQ